MKLQDEVEAQARGDFYVWLAENPDLADKLAEDGTFARAIQLTYVAAWIRGYIGFMETIEEGGGDDTR